MPTRNYLKASKGKFKVVGVDTFSNEDWVQGEFVSLQEAIDEANRKGTTMTKMYVYDDKGNQLHSAGTY